MRTKVIATGAVVGLFVLGGCGNASLHSGPRDKRRPPPTKPVATVAPASTEPQTDTVVGMHYSPMRLVVGRVVARLNRQLAAHTVISVGARPLAAAEASIRQFDGAAPRLDVPKSLSGGLAAVLSANAALLRDLSGLASGHLTSSVTLQGDVGRWTAVTTSFDRALGLSGPS